MALSELAQLHLRLITRHAERNWPRLKDLIQLTAELLGEEVGLRYDQWHMAQDAIIRAIGYAHRDPTDAEFDAIVDGMQRGYRRVCGLPGL